jgi:hypothetical protein
MMEDLQNHGNFPGPGIALYPDLNPCYNNSGERCYPFDCEWDSLHLLDSNSLDFDWISQPLGSLSTNQPAKFATEPWPNQLDMNLIGNFEESDLLVDLEQPFFMPPMTVGQVQSSIPAPHSNVYTARNVSASSYSMSSDSLSVPSTQETPLPVPSPDSSELPLYGCHICGQSYPTPKRLKYVLLPPS